MKRLRRFAFPLLLLSLLPLFQLSATHAHAQPAAPHAASPLQATPSEVNIAAIPGISPYPFSFPADHVFFVTLKNTSPNKITWIAGAVPSWILLQGNSGTIDPGGSDFLDFNFNIPLPLTQNYMTNLVLNTSGAPLVIPINVFESNVSKTWYFAEGYTGGSFNEWLTLANPNPATANVQVQYFLGNGAAPITKKHIVAPHSRFTVLVNNEVGNGQNVSMVVTSDQPIVAERPMYFTYTGLPGFRIPGGSDVLGATSLGTNFDFGYLDTTRGHDTYLTVLNQNSAPITAAIQYFASSGGAPTLRSHTIAANSRGTINVNSEGLPAGSYSALVTLSAPGLVERPLYLKDSTGATGSADVVGVATPQQDWYFAEGFTSSTFHERYILSNPNTSGTAHATVTFFLSSGKPITRSVTLTPGQQQIINANTALTSNNVNNSAQVHADLPILAERFISFTYTGAVGTGQHGNIPGASDVLGATAPSHTFYFAEGYSGPQFGEWLTIENPDPTNTANVMVTFLPTMSSAQPTIRLYQVAPSSRFTLFTNSVMPNQSFSMTLASDVPVVAERPMYFNYHNNGQTGGSDVVGYTGTIPPPAASPPPNGLSVYIGSEDGQVYALNANDGSVRWRYQTGAAISSSPTVLNGVLYIGSGDGYLYALNTSDGSLLWRFQTGGEIETTPVIVNGVIYFGSDDGLFHALNAQNGALVWQAGIADGTVIQTTAAIANGIVYYGTTGGFIYALNSQTGAEVWHVAIAGEFNKTEFLVANGVLYAADGFGLQAYNASNGTLIYTQTALRVPESSPTLVNGVLYIGTYSSSVDALDPTTGTILWQSLTTNVNLPRPAVVNGVVYIGSDDTYLYAFSASDGSLLWRSQTGGALRSDPAVVNGILYIGSRDGGVYAFNANDGSLLWRTLTTNRIDSSPVIAP